jgi:hypothetical protein
MLFTFVQQYPSNSDPLLSFGFCKTQLIVEKILSSFLLYLLP